MPKGNKKGSAKNAAGSRCGITTSPYVVGGKISCSVIENLKRFKNVSIPIPGATSGVSPKFIPFIVQGQEYPKEDIEKAMNEPEPEINESAVSNVKVIEEIVISDDDEPDLDDVNRNASASKEDMNENGDASSNEYVEISVEVSGPYENESDTSFLNYGNEYDVDESGAKLNGNVNGKVRSDSKLNDKASYSSKEEIDNCVDEPASKVKKGICAYSVEEIEKLGDKESLLEMFHNLQKEHANSQGKLKLKQKRHTKNGREALKSVNQNWVTCTQLVLRKLYNLMPEPRSITFETFLIFLQVDLDTVKYNPKTDSFA